MDKANPTRTSEPARSPAPRRTLPATLLVLAALASLAVIAWWRTPDNEGAEGEPPQGADPAAKAMTHLFGKWPKPDLALLLSAQQHGYLQPCGCSKPQYGGLTRRYNFLQILKGAGWPIVAVDLGDVSQASGLQKMLKYTTSMKALKLMNYTAVGIGENEIAGPLINVLGEYALNNPAPRVLANNLRNKDRDQAFHGMVESAVLVVGQGPLKVGIIGSVGASVTAKHKEDPDVKFDPVPQILPETLKALQARGPDFLVLLYEGTTAEAKRLAKAIPNFHVILCLSAEEEPPSVPERVGNTDIVTLGHKGRYVGVVGAYRTGKKEKPFELRYQLAPLGEEFDTPASKVKGHPLVALMEDYSREVKRRDFLAEAARKQNPHPVQLALPNATYVGSQVCKKCHEAAYEIWKNSPHAIAYETLEKAKHPSLRQYDAECIACHVTGWGYKGGFTDEVKTKILTNNGCENCHGPCSEHVKNPGDAKIHDLINPYRFDPMETAAARVRRINLIDQACQKCHDIENDVNWKFEKWWDGKIVHSEDKKKP